MSNTKYDLQIRRIAGGSIIKHAPLFSPDGELLFVIWSNTVRVYSTTTGEWLRDLDGFTNNIIGLEFDLNNPKILTGCSDSGEVISWKWRSGCVFSRGVITLTEAIQQQTICNFHLIDLDGIKSHGLVTWLTSENIWKISYINLETFKIETKCKTNNLQLNRSLVKVSVGPRALKYFAVIQNNKLYHVKLDTGDVLEIKSSLRFSTKNYTLVKCHPVSEAIITGCEEGKLLLWSNFDAGPNQFVSSVYLWHSQSVATVSFTEAGSGFYSGGLEAVLVHWTVDQPELRDFMPRMPGAICHIVVATGNQKFAVSTEDNSIRIISPNKKQLAVIQHFTRMNFDRTDRQNYPVGLKINPRTSSLALNGREGYLQFFSTHTRNLLYNIEILQENRLIPEQQKVLFNTRVTKAAMTMDWMVTAESWDDRVSSPITRLRFWEFNQQKQTYELNTCIETPHSRSVTALEFSSMYTDDNLLCASSGGDNLIKVWAPCESDSIYNKGIVWYCVAQTNFKNMPVYSLCFSHDGSVLSAGCGNTLCVWSAENLKLKCALSTPQAMDGNTNKIVFEISENIRPGNGVTPQMKKKEELRHKSLVEKRKRIIDGIKEMLLQKDNHKFVNFVAKEDVKPRFKRVNVKSLNIKEQEILFKKIRSISELTLRQKFELFSFLRIGCHTNQETKQKLTSMLNERNKVNQAAELEVSNIIEMLSAREKFLIKNKFNMYRQRKKLFYKNHPTVLPFAKIFGETTETSPGVTKLNGKLTKQNGMDANGQEMDVQSDNDEMKPEEECHLPIKRLSQINHVLFGSSEFSHLVTVCTKNRLLVWNLLTLRLQTSIKLSVDKMCIDPYTNLLAAFTIHNELYVFLPNTPIPLYHRKNMPAIYGAAWVPRRIAKSQSLSLDWQATSQLYFLNTEQELLYLISDNDPDGIAPTVALSSDNPQPLPLTPFGAILTKQMDNDELRSLNSGRGVVGVTNETMVKELITQPSHTMCPIHQLSKKFIHSLLLTNTSHMKQRPLTKSRGDTDVKTIEESGDDDDEEMGMETGEELRTKINNRRHKSNLANDLTKIKCESEFLAMDNRLRKIAQQKVKFSF